MPCISMGSGTRILTINAMSIKLDGIAPYISPKLSESLWMTQRLCRIQKGKPLLLRWPELHEMFGGQSNIKRFKEHFRQDLKAAVLSYPAAQVEEHGEGFLFYASLPPIPKTQVLVDKLLE